MMQNKTNKGLIFSLAFTCIVFIFIGYGIIVNDNNVKEQQKQMYANAIQKAALNCYSNEGFYPDDLDYLAKHYGLVINDNYSLFYEVIASNIMPTIKVVG